MKPLFSTSRNASHTLVGIFLLAIFLLTTSCGNDGFKIENGKVYYSYWTFSFGQRNDELPDADPNTFKEVNNWLGRDARHVYFKDRLVHGADPATVVAEKYPLFRDKNDYYIQGTPLHVADMKSFKVLRQIENDIWAKDSRYAYYDSTRFAVDDIKNFKVVEWNYATDGIHIYLHGKKLADSDPDTFQDLGGCYYRDKARVWFLERPVVGADPATFQFIGHGYAKDKAHIYYDERIVTDADYATFIIDEYGDARDKNGRFAGEIRFEDVPMPEAPEPVPESELK